MGTPTRPTPVSTPAWPLAALLIAATLRADEAKFFRGIVLNGPPLTIDGQSWDGKDAKDFTVTGKRFENQNVALKPPTDAARTRMSRSSVWGDKVEMEFSNVPPGDYQTFLYVWEDNHNERFNVLVNGKVVVEAFESGTAGMWKKLGPFPFPAFWGPMAGLPSSAWIARAAGEVLELERPDLSLVYLPHLDYDPQRFGPSGSDMPRLVRELDDACEPLLAAAKEIGARVWVVSEYGLVDVDQPVLLNRVLRQNGFLSVRPGPFGDQPGRSATPRTEQLHGARDGAGLPAGQARPS